MDLSSLPKAGALTAAGARAVHWRPGLPCPSYSEVFAPAREASGAAAALALLLDGVAGDGAWLWVQDQASLRLNGRPYRPGLPPRLRARTIHVAARTPEDALFALEEGLRCRELAGVIGEIAGNPRALDFTASRRLGLAAEAHGVPLLLVRLDAVAHLSAARLRWRIAAAPSPRPRWNAAAPGAPAWQAELFRARAHPPGEWTLIDDGTALVAERPAADRAAAPDHGDLAAAAGARSLAAHARLA
jgi:protein ImuA